jgi:hypothetical protein
MNVGNEMIAFIIFHSINLLGKLFLLFFPGNSRDSFYM